MTTGILLSGFGGQGVMSAGKFLAHAALHENKYSIFLPSYGAEVRGGTAYCSVKISDAPINSPLIDNPDIAIILNQPSLDRFEAQLPRGCLVIVNTDLTQRKVSRKDVTVIELPLNTLAIQCGNIKTANVIALGALLACKPIFKKATLVGLIKEMLSSQDLIRQNLAALDSGLTYLKENKKGAQC